MRFAFIFAVIVSVISSPAMAFIGGQLLIGQRTTKFENSSTDKTLKGSEMQASLHLDPIPLIPISFGLKLSQITFKEKDNYKADGLEIAPEVMAWLPIDIANLTFFAKVGYTAYGVYVTESETTAVGATVKYKMAYKPSGTRISVGAIWSPLPLIGVLAEYEITNHKLAFDKIKTGTETDSSKIDLDANGTAILIGARVHI